MAFLPNLDGDLSLIVTSVSLFVLCPLLVCIFMLTVAHSVKRVYIKKTSDNCRTNMQHAIHAGGKVHFQQIYLQYTVVPPPT